MNTFTLLIFYILFEIVNNGHTFIQNLKGHTRQCERLRALDKTKILAKPQRKSIFRNFLPRKLVVFGSLINDAIETLQISPAVFYLGRTIAIGVVWNRWKTPCSFWEVMNFPEWLPQPPMRRLKIPFSRRDNEKRSYKTWKSSKAGESATTVTVEGFHRFRRFEVGLLRTDESITKYIFCPKCDFIENFSYHYFLIFCTIQIFCDFLN